LQTLLSGGTRTALYTVALAYCFIRLPAITARFFKSMEQIMKHYTNETVVKREKLWNYSTQ
jgi:magnesium/proton exchanger